MNVAARALVSRTIAGSVAASFLLAGALAQEAIDQGTSQGIPTGSLSINFPTTFTFTYDLAPPVGASTLSISRDPDGSRIVSSYLKLGADVRITLPSKLLGCIPFPRLRDTRLSTYAQSTAGDKDWLPSFYASITFYFGNERIDYDTNIVESDEYPSVTIDISGTTVVRALFSKAPGERRYLRPVTNECPAELIKWSLS